MAGKHDRTQTVARLSEPMRRGLVYIAARPDGRMHHLDTTVRANTITALMSRGLVTQTVARGTVLFYAITPAGRAAAGVDEPIVDGLFAQDHEVAPEPAQGALAADQADGLACSSCGVCLADVASVPAGRSHAGSQTFVCLGCADANGDEVDAPTPEPSTDDHDTMTPRAYGENRLPGWPAADIGRWVADDVLSGEMPFSGEPIPTATVDRPSGGDGASAPISLWWLSAPCVRLS